MKTTTNRAYKILLIGAGQLGSRYLQGIVKSELNFEIIVVDLSQDSLETAKKRIEEVGNCKKIIFTKKLPIDQNFFDICIVSTTANSRRSIVENVYRLFEAKLRDVPDPYLIHNGSLCRSFPSRSVQREDLTRPGASGSSRTT